ncbi:MAG: hypothetical protein WC831_01820 [Parcubacteria group bacterium]|jgi:hypothetical protein
MFIEVKSEERKIGPESVEQMESAETIAKEKTPEEQRAENIELMTQRARHFIAEKKAEKEKKNARRELESVPQDVDRPEGRQNEEAEDAQEKPGEQKGIISGLKDKYRLWKLKRSGFPDPGKALGFFEYISSRADSTLKFDSDTLNLIRDTFRATNDPIAFYEKIKQLNLKIAQPIIKPNYGLGTLMRDPDIFKKLDLWQSVNESLGFGDANSSGDDLRYFCGETELHAGLSAENLNRISQLRNLSGSLFSVSDLNWLANCVEDRHTFESLGKLLGSEYAKNLRDKNILRVEDLAKKLKDLDASGMTESLLIGADMNLDVGSAIRELTSEDEEEKAASVEKTKALELEERAKDEKFRELAGDLSLFSGKDFGINEYQKLESLYQWHKDYALAFAQAFEDLGILNRSQEGTLNLEEFEDTLGHWKNEAGYGSPEVFFALLDPSFNEMISILKREKGDFKTRDIFRYAFLYAREPEVIKSLESDEGKELLQFFTERGMDFLGHAEFFKHPGIAKMLKGYDEFFDIQKGWSLDGFLELYNRGETANELLDYLKENKFKPDGKFEINKIPLLVKIHSIKDSIDAEYFRKYPNFFLSEKTVDFIISDPSKAPDVFSLAEDGYLEGQNFQSIRWFLQDNLEDILAIPREKRDTYMKLYRRLDGSPSQEIQRLKKELTRELLKLDEPESAYQRIEEIFITNNLPPVGKIYKVFAVIHSPAAMQELLESNDRLSPCLRESSVRKRYTTIYRDLLNIHIKSGNRILRDYLEVANEGQGIFDKMETEGEESLNNEERRKAEFVLKKLKTLWENSSRGMRMDPNNLSINDGLGNFYNNLKTSIGAKEGQTVTARISQMFLAPAGYQSIEHVLAAMNEAKGKAGTRGLETADLLRKGEFNIKAGDVIKGMPSGRMGAILQGGAVAGEYLGSESSSDSTPYDSDVFRVSDLGGNADFSENIKKYFGEGYGDVNIIVRDRGQFDETSKGSSRGYDPSKLELFRTGVISNEHYGIRTGFPSSEIDLMVVSENTKQDEKRMSKLFFDIAENGFYIPVADTSGKLIFSPEQYEEYRRIFRGLERFDGNKFEYLNTKEGDQNYDEVERIRREFKEDRDRVAALSQKIRDMITDVLRQHEVTLRDNLDNSILGAELMDIGSTARHTNAIGDYDFDLTLRLDDRDMDKIGDIVRDLQAGLQAESYSDSHGDEKGGYQLRAKQGRLSGENPADIDIGFVRKSDLVYFGSHEAVQERLDWIKNNISEEAYEKTIANVILAKKILKEGKAYKRVEDGGMGGISVENWILLNSGNLVEAFRTFLAAAIDENGTQVPLDEFKQKYKILNPGMNLKKLYHDNYTMNLKEGGYNAMIKTIENYLKG